jgi:hypothetical protein
MKRTLFILSILFLFASIVPTSHQMTSSSDVSTTTSTTNIVGTNTLLLPSQIIVTPGTSSYKQISTNCYSAIVNMTVTNNSTIISAIEFQWFKIVIVQPNEVIANTTTNSFNIPNNKINTVTLFPPMANATGFLVPLPVIMEISFNNICLPPATNPNNDIHLIYFDSQTFRSWLPTFGPNNTINWN